MKGWVYILECSDGSYYVGSTNDIQRRIVEHRRGSGSIYTARRLPIKLQFLFECSTVQEAFRLEHQIKKWSRAKKQALISRRYDLLPELSRKKSKKSAGARVISTSVEMYREHLIKNHKS